MSTSSEAAAEKARHSGLVPGLELVRGLASLQVFLCHLFLFSVFNNLPANGRPFWIEAFFSWGTEAVLIFFVLSGLVIALSQRKSRRDQTGFMRARLRRIGPLYLVAILLAFLVDHVLLHHFNWKPLWGHLLFLQLPGPHAPVAPTFYSNGPLWSLSFEFYFYLLFSFTIGAGRAWVRPGLWIAGFGAMVFFWRGGQPQSIPMHLLEIVACMPVWLLGVTLIGKPIYFRPSLGQNLVLFSIMFIISRSFYNEGYYSPRESLLAALFIAPLLYSLANPQGKTAARDGWLSWLIVGALYGLCAFSLCHNQPPQKVYPYRDVNLFLLAVPPVLALLVIGKRLTGLRMRASGWSWEKFALFLGRISYAVYVIHLPICSFIGHKTRNPAARITLDLALVLFLAWLFEYRLHPYLCDKFDRLWPERRRNHEASVSGAEVAPAWAPASNGPERNK